MASAQTQFRKRNAVRRRVEPLWFKSFKKISEQQFISQKAIIFNTNTQDILNQLLNDTADITYNTIRDNRLSLENQLIIGAILDGYYTLSSGNKAIEIFKGLDSFFSQRFLETEGLGIRTPTGKSQYINSRLESYSKMSANVQIIDYSEKANLAMTVQKKAVVKGTELSTFSSARALNSGNYDEFKKLDMKKRWSALFDNTRPAHATANGQTVPIEQPFIVDGEQLMHPGDFSRGASIGNIANCNCSSLEFS